MTKDEELDDIVDQVQLGETSEMEGMANQIFKASTSRTNLSADEIGMTFSTGIVFSALGMVNHDPSLRFMELKKSQGGWSTEKFVQAAGGVQDQRSGGSMGAWMKDRLFTPK